MEVGPVQSGDLIAKKYVIDRVIGAGGMGVVVAAKHVDLDQTVAIKFLRKEAWEDQAAAERFLREARAAAKIQSEHVARVMDVGRLDTGSPYMVMEYLDGIDLSTELGQRGSLPPLEAVQFMLQAMEALAEAHASNIVHRDLKPANLFLTKRKDGSRSIKVLDFGISKAAYDPNADPEAEEHLTLTSAMLGSPQYMAPEQVRNAKTVDMRADIWSLGIILYECLSGEVPFEGQMLSGVLAAIVADPPRPLKEVRMDIPSRLAAVVSECLQKDPDKRVQNVSELAYLLCECEPEASPVSLDRIYSVMGKPKARTISSLANTAAGGVVSIKMKAPNESENGEAGPTLFSQRATAPPIAMPSKTPPAQTPTEVQQRVLFDVGRPLPFLLGGVAAAVLLGVLLANSGTEGAEGQEPVQTSSSASLGQDDDTAETPQTQSPAIDDPEASAPAPEVKPETETETEAETETETAAPHPVTQQVAAKQRRPTANKTHPVPASPAKATSQPSSSQPPAALEPPSDADNQAPSEARAAASTPVAVSPVPQTPEPVATDPLAGRH